MFELGLGVLLAVFFIAAYLLITRLLGHDGRELGGLPPRVTLNPLDTDKAIGAGKSSRALTTGEMSEHHAGGAKSAGSKQEGTEQS
jgi:hypothetical protein